MASFTNDSQKLSDNNRRISYTNSRHRNINSNGKNNKWSSLKSKNSNNRKSKARSGRKGSRFGQTLGTDRHSRGQWNHAVSRFQSLIAEIENDIDDEALKTNFTEIIQQFQKIEYPTTAISKLDCSSLVRGMCNIFKHLKAKRDQIDQQRVGGLQVFKDLSSGTTSPTSFDTVKIQVCDFVEQITMKQEVEYGAADLGDIIPFLVNQITETKSISSIQSLAAVLKEHNSRCTIHYKLILDALLNLTDKNSSASDEIIRGALFSMANLCGSGIASATDGTSSAAVREGLKAAGAIRIFTRTSQILQDEHRKYVLMIKNLQSKGAHEPNEVDKSIIKNQACNPEILSTAMRTFAAIIFALPSVLDSASFGINLTTILHDFLRFKGMHKSILNNASRRPLSNFEDSVGRGSDSEINYSDSDTDGHSFRSSSSSFRVSVSLHSLSALLAVCRSKPKYILERWVHYLPETSHSWSNSSSYVNKKINRRRERYRSLIDIMINERSWRLRSAATCLVISMVDSAPFSNWLPKKVIVEHKSNLSPSITSPSRARRTPAFIPMSTRVTNSIDSLHKALCVALRKENNGAVVAQLLRCFTSLLHRVPYDQMPNAVQKTIYMLIVHSVKYINDKNNNIDLSVKTIAFNMIGSAFSTKFPLIEIETMLTRVDMSKTKEQSESSLSLTSLSLASSSTTSVVNTPTKNNVWIPPHKRNTPTSSKSIAFNSTSTPSKELNEYVIVSIMQGSRSNPSILFILAKMSRTYPNAVGSWWKYGLQQAVLAAFSSRDNRVRENAIKVVDSLNKGGVKLNGLADIIESHIVRALSDTNNAVRTSVLQLVQGLGSSGWNFLENHVQSEILRLVSFSFHDNAPKVRTAACYVIGTYVLLEWAQNEEILRKFANDLLSILEKEETLVVVSRCTWALANLCSCLIPEQPHREGGSLGNDLKYKNMSRNFFNLTKRISDVVISLAENFEDQSQTQDKIRTSSIRALGSLGQYWSVQSINKQTTSGVENVEFQTVVSKRGNKKIVNNKVPIKDIGNASVKNDPRDEIQMLDVISRTLLKHLDSGTPKTRWNACHALGGIYEAACIHQKFGFLSEQSWHIRGLNLLLSCMESTNFKVRINAITATRALRNIFDFPKDGDKNLYDIFSKTVTQCMENVDEDSDFAQYQYKETLEEQCVKTLEHLESLK
jgi:hypothetical protein